MTKPDLSELLTLIKLLKAEGVKEYTAHGVHLAFFDRGIADSTLVDSVFGGPAVQNAQETASAEDAKAGLIDENPVLRRLNPNYARLTSLRTK